MFVPFESIFFIYEHNIILLNLIYCIRNTYGVPDEFFAKKKEIENSQGAFLKSWK
jgi:DUF1365 family protein